MTVVTILVIVALVVVASVIAVKLCLHHDWWENLPPVLMVLSAHGIQILLIAVMGFIGYFISPNHADTVTPGTLGCIGREAEDCIRVTKIDDGYLFVVDGEMVETSEATVTEGPPTVETVTTHPTFFWMPLPNSTHYTITVPDSALD